MRVGLVLRSASRGKVRLRQHVDAFRVVCHPARMSASLTTARRLYERAGYQLVTAEPEQAFGQDLINETWELDPARPG